MGSLYGHKWSSAYGDKADPDRVWEACMVDLTETQVRHGLRECVNSGLEWPPSAPEFRKLCTGETDTRWEHKQIERADREFAERMIPRMTEDRAAIARREMDKIRQSLGMPRREN